MKMRQFWTTGVFMLPWTGLMIFYGTTLSSIQDAIEGNYKMGPFGLTAMIAGSVVAIIPSVFLSFVVNRHLKKMIADAEKAKKDAEAAEKAEADKEKCNPQTGSGIELQPIEGLRDRAESVEPPANI